MWRHDAPSPARRRLAAIAAVALVLGAPGMVGQASTVNPTSFTSPAWSTTVSGVLQADTHWTRDGSPYVVGGQLIVEPGVTLTIDPGVEVRFEPGSSFRVAGSIVAAGTAEAPIQFLGTQEQPGSWAGIDLVGSGLAPASGTFRYATIAHAGGSGGYGADLYVYAGQLEVSDSEVRDGGGDGIVAEWAALRLHAVTVTRNAAVAVRVITMSSDAPAALPVLEQLTVTANGTDAVTIESPSALRADARWPQLPVPYRIVGQLIVEPGVTLTIDAGTIMEFNSGSELVVRGILDAIGTAESPIAFRGVVATAGSWSGIHIIGSGLSPAYGSFDHVTINGAGDEGGAVPALSVSDGGITFLRGEISDASGDGLEVSGSTPIGATRVEASQLVRIAGDGVANYASTMVLATNNWWGSSEGPTPEDECVTSGGTSVSGLVRYAPWLHAEDAAPDPLAASDRLVIAVVPQRWYAPADGQTRMWVDLTVRDPDGHPLPGRTVTLIATRGDVISGGTTDAAGHSLAYIVSSSPGDAELRAILADAEPCELTDSNDVLVTFTNTPDDLLVGMEAPYLFNGIEVDPQPVTRGVDTTLRATIANPNEQAIQVEVQFELADFGIGLVFGPIGEAQTKEVPAGGQTVFETTWTPEVAGHVCVQVLYHILGPTSGGGGSGEVAAIGGPPPGEAGGSWQAPSPGSGQLNLNVYGGPTGGGTSNGGDGDKESLKKAQKAGAIMGAIGSVGTGETFIPGIAVGLGTHWQIGKSAEIARQMGGDPPRLDYTEVATVQPVTVDLGERPSGVSAEHWDAIVALNRALAQFTAVGDAAVICLDRYGGASAAQDLHWASVQASSLVYYRRQLGSAATVVANAIADLRAVLTADGFDVALTAEEVRASLERLRTQGFRADDLATAHDAGLDDDAIELMRQAALNLDPEELAGPVMAHLADFEDAMRVLGPSLTPEMNFPSQARGPAMTAALGGVPVAAETSQLTRIYDVTTTFPVGNPLDDAATIELRIRPISLPAGWVATVSPASVELGPGEQATALVIISPAGPTVEETIPRVAVEGYVGDELLGGVVVGILVPSWVPVEFPSSAGLPALPFAVAMLCLLGVGVGGWWAMRRRRLPPAA